MNTSTKLNILFVLATLVIARSASLMLTTPMQRLRSHLASVQLDHSEVYDSIRTRRFNNPEKVLPMQAITGMEPIQYHLRSLDEVHLLKPRVVYGMFYTSLTIFSEAFEHIVIEEALSHPSFQIEVRQIYHDIESLLSLLRQVMDRSDIPDFEPNIVLESEVDGMICGQDCKQERNLYIHQQFNYFIDRMAYTIATLNEEF